MATSNSAAVCQACRAGQYCAGAQAPAVACPSDMWDHDGNPATACIAKSTCPAGTYVSDAGSATTDRSCMVCAAGTFSTTSNTATCAAWTDCAIGSYVAVAPSATANRQCAACPDGTFSTSPNQESCTAISRAAGSAPSAYSGGVTCKACSAGEYCAGGGNPAVPYSAETWDNDADPSTACVAKTVCPPGSAVLDPGSGPGGTSWKLAWARDP